MGPLRSSLVITTQHNTSIFQAIYLMTEQDLEKISDAPEVRTRDIFQKMDTNSDGVLSQEEFVRGCMNDETLYKLLACSEDDDAH